MISLMVHYISTLQNLLDEFLQEKQNNKAKVEVCEIPSNYTQTKPSINKSITFFSVMYSSFLFIVRWVSQHVRCDFWLFICCCCSSWIIMEKQFLIVGMRHLKAPRVVVFACDDVNIFVFCFSQWVCFIFRQWTN